MNTDLQKLEGRLRDFLGLIDNQPLDRPTVAVHLRYPSASGTLAGSALGRHLWDSQQGSALISCLLEDEQLRDWFAPPPDTRLNELHFRIASLVDRWHDAGGARGVLPALAAELTETLHEPEVAATAAQVLFGLAADFPVALPYDFRIAQASQSELETLLSAAGAQQVEILRIPARPALVAAVRVRIARAHMGGMAGITAISLPTAMLEGLRFTLWLATGAFCAKGDYYVSEESPFPIARLERHRASFGDLFPSGLDGPMGKVDPVLLYDLTLRHEGGIKGLANIQLPDDIFVPLWTASTFLDAALRSPDWLFGLFFTYSALEGMLLLSGDDESRIGPRLARLIGRDVQERKDIRRIVYVWRLIRGSAAHGHRGEVVHLLRFLGRAGENVQLEAATASELQFREWQDEARRRALELSRRAYVAMLYLLTQVEAGSVEAGMEREAALTLVEAAERDNDQAISKLEAVIPPVAKGIEA